MRRSASTSSSSRRTFLKSSAMAAAAAFASPLILRADPASTAQNSKLNIALIGCGGQGMSDMKNLLGQGENFVAVCDVDEKRAAGAVAEIGRALSRRQAADRAKTPKLYTDYRKLLEDEKGIDAVLIATPDHWHVPLCKAVIRAGKHVYCEKPLAHSIGEARELREIARASKLITQLGNQGSASASLRRSVELIQAGVLGQIHEIHVWLGGNNDGPSEDAPAGEDPIPPELNWDFWCGPAPLRPYKKGVYHPFQWRHCRDFGSGQLGDIACHSLNLPMRALDLGYPTRIEIDGPGWIKDRVPGANKVRFIFPARAKLDPVTIHWYDGKPIPPDDILADIKAVYHGPQRGCFIIGQNGCIHTDPWNQHGLIKLKSDDRLRDVTKHEATKDIPITLPRTRGHEAEWADACKGGPPTFSNFDLGGHLTEIALAGVLALRLGHPIDWNGEKMQSPNEPAADAIIHPTLRTKWII